MICLLVLSFHRTATIAQRHFLLHRQHEHRRLDDVLFERRFQLHLHEEPGLDFRRNFLRRQHIHRVSVRLGQRFHPRYDIG